MNGRSLFFLLAITLCGCDSSLPFDALAQVDGLSRGDSPTCAHRRDGCARRRNGNVVCWRDGYAPDDAPLSKIADVLHEPSSVLGVPHARGIAAAAENWLAAERVSGADHLTELVVGSSHACGIREDGHVFCWDIRA